MVRRGATQFSVALPGYLLHLRSGFQVQVRSSHQIRSIEVMYVRLWPSPEPTVYERRFWNLACGVSLWAITKCISKISLFGDLRSDIRAWPLHWNTMKNLTTQTSPGKITQLRYNFQNKHIVGPCRPKDHQFWLVTISRSFQVTCL